MSDTARKSDAHYAIGKKNPNLPFHPGVRAGDFIFISGQVSKDADGNMLCGTIEEETAGTIQSIERILAEEGATLQDVVRVTTYLDDPRDFGRYTHLLLVNGATGDWGERERDALRDWVGGGGVVVATKSAAVWAAEHLLENEEPEEPKEDEDESEESEEEGPPAAYLDYEDLSALQRVSGTIFQSRLDLTHPLCFGYVRECLPVFRNSTDLLPEGEDPFGTPVRYTDKPLLSGFASEENVELIAGSPAVRAARVGAGSVICMVDNPNFRGVWYGTNRLYTNAIYFGPALKPTGPIEVGAARGR